MRTSCSPAVQGGCGASWALHVYPGKPTIPILCSQDLLLQSPERPSMKASPTCLCRGMPLLCPSGSAQCIGAARCALRSDTAGQRV